ncbi:MAG: toll/interleukin-1 receptor domain-containing protein [Acidithiobacillus ferriphilus]
MIFLSHNQKDKPVVEQIALRLKEILPQDEIFYDSWSIQPGDGIIDKMNEGLANCRLFLFFVSKNSLQSEMVKLEWQNALLKATKGQTKIIPVKMDDCLMPPILMQSLYIDLFGQGLEIALRQIMDVISGKNTFAPGPQEFANLRGYAYDNEGAVFVECRAEYYMEPISRFVFLVENKEGELTFECTTSPMCISGFNKDVKLNDGRILNGQLVALDRATTPGYPFIVKITCQAGADLKLVGVLHEKRYNQWHEIPLAFI